MFDIETVIITGAGASWHYGYPTGEALISEIIREARSQSVFWHGVVKENPFVRLNDFPSCIPQLYPETPVQSYLDGLNTLSENLQNVKPLVIDYYLGLNPSLSNLGKFLIAAILQDCERSSTHKQPNKNNKDGARGDDWLRFVVTELLNGCKAPEDILKNKITFVTFNYDISLERRLFEMLDSIEILKPKGLAQTFLENNRVIHIYGKLGELETGAIPTISVHASKGARLKATMNLAYSASKSLKTIAPEEKTITSEVEFARDKIATASYLYFLGYGFDENNNSLLGLPARQVNKQIRFTNFEDKNKINKVVARTFGVKGNLLMGSNFLAEGSNCGCEKSVRNVYDALALDFDWPPATKG